MDIEKLIEQVNARGLGNGTSLGYHSGLFDEAATALSTLQAENEKLRETVDKYATAARAIALHLKPFCDESLTYDEMIADAARKASDELEQVKRCIEIIEKQRDSAIEELENYMIQDVLDGNEPCGICAKASDTQCECCDPKWRGPKKED